MTVPRWRRPCPCTRRCRLRCSRRTRRARSGRTRPSSARPVTISSGTSPFVRWTCSACGAMTLRANDPNESATISMSPSRWRGPGLIGERRRGTPGARYALMNSCALPRGSRSTPHIASRPITLRRQVVQHVGGEGTGDPGLEVTLGPVVEQRFRRGHAGGGVGDVVREHLVHVGPAAGGQRADRGAHDLVGEVDGVGRGGNVRGRDFRGSHGSRDYWAVTGRTFSAALDRGGRATMSVVASIGVFCGSNFGADPAVREAADDLGRTIASERTSPRLRRRARRVDGRRGGRCACRAEAR